MTPIQIAKQIREEQIPEQRFETVLNDYLKSDNGIVVSNPVCFAMGGAVQIEWKHCWYVDTAVGKLGEILRAMPFRLPYVAFQRGKRGNKLKIYPTSSILRLVK